MGRPKGSKNQRPSKALKPRAACLICGEPTNRPGKNYCSLRCVGVANKNKAAKARASAGLSEGKPLCKVCGKPCSRYRSVVCSAQCNGKFSNPHPIGVRNVKAFRGAKHYLVTSPDGVSYRVFDLLDFCRTNATLFADIPQDYAMSAWERAHHRLCATARGVIGSWYDWHCVELTDSPPQHG